MGLITTGNVPKAIGGGMGKLSSKERKALPKSDFALPGGRYPIPDPSHARNALARGAQHASPAEQATIRRKVEAKFPSIDVANHNDGGCAHHNGHAMAHPCR